MTKRRTTCPDCETEMQPIRLLDATNIGLLDPGANQIEPEYAALDATAHWFTKTTPKAGTVKAQICPDCGRILLFGSPN